MTKQEQIKEMTKFAKDNIEYVTLDANSEYATEVIIDYDRFAEALYNAGYRKVPEGAVVLTKEECDNKVILDEDHFERILTNVRKDTAKETLQKNL